MKGIPKLLLAAGLLMCGPAALQAQIALQYTDTTICPGNTIQMCAAFTGEADPLNTDDKFTGLVNIGFDFVFFGNAYSSCTVSDNGFLSFNGSLASQHSAYTWSSSVGNGEANNAIHAAMVDLYLPASGQIRYQYFGNPGSRRFIVEWCNVALYGCHNFKVTTQVILYEGSNIIEIYTTNLDPITGNCPSASGGSYGLVVQGLRDATGGTAIYTPGRDPVGNWGTLGDNSDAVRFTPDSTNNYLVDTTITFNPWVIIDEASSDSLKWFAPQNLYVPVATGACATVTPTAGIRYYIVRYDGLAGCGNDTVSFTDTVRIHYATTYDTIDVEICNGETYNFYGREVYASGLYDTLFSSTQGCDSLVALNLTVNPLPDIALNHRERLVELCEGDSFRVFALDPGAETQYQWWKEGAPFYGSTGPEIYLKEPGQYRLMAVTDKGCEDASRELNVVVHERPVAEILPREVQEEEVICAFDTTLLRARVGAAGDQYSWSPPEAFRRLNLPEGPEVSGAFPEPTWVTLTVTSSYGCSDSTGIMVMTRPCCEVFMPNAFTPNGDGLNDFFKPQLQPSQLLVGLKIFNRFGQLIYDNDNPRRGWDGNYADGTPASTETYMFLVEYTCADGKNYQEKGSLSLMR